MKILSLPLIALLAITGCTQQEQPAEPVEPDATVDLADEPADGVFAAIETGDDAVLTLEEFTAGLEQEAFFAEFDGDRNGVLDEQEFAYFAATGLHPGATFAEYDADASGSVSRDAFYAALFASLDRNGDGSLDGAERADGFGGQAGYAEHP